MTTGIPTTYRGILFRSRAEARWAAFFDRLEWLWSYEPIDLDGYIPDFLVASDHTKQALFEVKGGVLGIHELNEHTTKIEGSGWRSEAVVVGAAPSCIARDHYVLGVSAAPQSIAGGAEWDWQSCEFFYCLSCGRISFMTPANSWACRLCGADEGDAHVGAPSPGLISDAWAEASNRVQWRPAAE